MIYEDAIYDVLNRAIEAVTSGAEVDPLHPLYQAALYQTLRGNLKIQENKIIRISTDAGQFAFQNEDAILFENVSVIIQCYARSGSKNETEIDDAEELSFEIATKVFKTLAANPTLKNAAGEKQVCVSLFRDYKKGTANVFGAVHGATFIYGVINQRG